MSVKKIRLSRGMTQEELAKQLEVSRSAVAMWETGDAMPRMKLLPKLAEVLNCKIEELLAD